MRRNYNLNHSRVEIYKVSKRDSHHNFAISPQYVHEEKLKFVYNDKNGETIEKIIPMTYIGQYLTNYVPFYTYNDFTLRKKYRGAAYLVKEEVIFNY